MRAAWKSPLESAGGPLCPHAGCLRKPPAPVQTTACASRAATAALCLCWSRTATQTLGEAAGLLMAGCVPHRWPSALAHCTVQLLAVLGGFCSGLHGGQASVHLGGFSLPLGAQPATIPPQFPRCRYDYAAAMHSSDWERIEEQEPLHGTAVVAEAVATSDGAAVVEVGFSGAVTAAAVCVCASLFAPQPAPIVAPLSSAVIMHAFRLPAPSPPTRRWLRWWRRRATTAWTSAAQSAPPTMAAATRHARREQPYSSGISSWRSGHLVPRCLAHGGCHFV